MPGSNGQATLALALDRAPVLSCREKELVFDALREPGRFAATSEYALSLLLGRRFAPRSGWDPQELVAEAELELAYLEKRGWGFVRFGAGNYPPALAETSDPPFVLRYRGALPDFGTPALAVVGTRFPTGAGLDAAFAIGRSASERGIQVVSGLARGIDAASHAGAIAGGTPTFAVLGCGLDTVYPPRNRALAARILESGGGLLSEHPAGTPPMPFRFPERNRIIAGLCYATVVVEAPEKSGALITAQFALDEGRDVFVSGRTLSGPRSAGCRRLAEDGAVDIIDTAETAMENSSYAFASQ